MRALIVSLVLLAGALRASADGGDLDPSFGSGGIVTTALGDLEASGQSLAIQPDGRIVVGGYYRVSPLEADPIDIDFALLRYNPDGTLDQSFGSDGVVFTAPTARIDRIDALALDGECRIVVAGDMDLWEDFSGRFGLARYLPNGSLDTSFGFFGTVSTAVPGGGSALSMVLQPDGKIVASGWSLFRFETIRYNNDGSLDSAFGVGGRVVEDFHGNGFGSALQADGKIVVAGVAYLPGRADIAVVRYNSDGSRDTSFDGDGKVITAVGPYGGIASAVAIQPDGKIVATGWYSNAPADAFVAVRYLPDGSLDPSFGSGGVATPNVDGSIYPTAFSIAEIQADGRIVLAGGYSDGLGSHKFALVRFKGNGTLDATFGGDGIVITTVGARSTVNATAIQDDGKIVAAGFGTGTAAAVVAVARYLPGPRCAQRAEPSSCRTAERSLLMADRVGDARRQRLVWKWWRGQTTSPAEFGDPTTTTDYALCFYGGSDGTLIGEAAIYVPANGTRWRRVRTGYRYHDQAGNADGVRRAWLRSSGRARTRLYFRARGAGLPELAAALAPESLPLIVRWTGNDACWESRFTAADVTVANGGSFEARSR